ncbi:MAG: MoaD/ThiS family protein [Candidatus Anammoximicrobium sp.]|nr:MoaD/ThiS family protein [Candidatus Anammoximicrobium sp.]
MKTAVKLFALARQLAGQDEIQVDLPPGATVAQLRSAVSEQYPALAELASRSLFAVDANYATDQTPVPPSAVLACIPPVSGG